MRVIKVTTLENIGGRSPKYKNEAKTTTFPKAKEKKIQKSARCVLYKCGILKLLVQQFGPGWMHETSAQTWCTGKTQRERVEREVGGGIGMGTTCKSMADSCQCMTKTTTIL